jgi:HSP20 family protein
MRYWSQDPWRQIRRLQDEMNRVFSGIDRPRATAFPPVNVWSSPEGVAVTAELPGIDPSNLEISATDDNLTLQGERPAPVSEEGVTWHRRERRSGRFSRTIQLPFRIDADSVDASFRDGVLRISLSRPEEEKPRKIEVKAS